MDISADKVYNTNQTDASKKILMGMQIEDLPSSVGGNNTVEEAYNYVFKPLLLELNKLGQSFPLTIVYCKLQWCSYGVHLSRRLLGQSIDLSVVQYHAQQPDEVSLNLYFLDLTSMSSSTKM
jgi:hypothetical protein